jgi:ethanolamine utilization protein EutN
MLLARVIGNVVSTRKDDAMQGRKLLLLRPLLVDEASPHQLRPGANTVVAVDSLGAGEGETVLFCQGSSARQAAGMLSVPVDAVVVGIVDAVDVLDHAVYPTPTKSGKK